MTKSDRPEKKKRGLSTWLVAMTILMSCFGNRAIAQSQIVPDNTLGEEKSTVVPNGEIEGLPAELIEGGAQRGANLFHSFQKFNVGAGQRVDFANPAGIANILTRVTGSNISNILGTLGVDGAADLFLINPNGIIFGENASLDVNGSFISTTADAIQFGEQGFFDATEPNAPPLLTVQPSAFFFNQMNPGSIESRSIAPAGLNASGNTPLVGLRVADGKDLIFLGGDITIDGGGFSEGGGLSAVDGRVELAAIADTGTVLLNEDNSLSLPDDIARADIALSNGAIIDTSAEGRGAIALQGNNLEIADAGLFNQILIEPQTQLTPIESITLDATKAIAVVNSTIDGTIFEAANAGQIDIISEESISIDNSQIANNIETNLELRGGNINVTTRLLEIDNESRLSTITFAASNAGNINIKAKSINIANGSLLFNSTQGTGNAGNINVEANSFILLDGGQLISTSDGEQSGNAGNIQVTSESTVFSGVYPVVEFGRLTPEERQVVIENEETGGFSSGLFVSAEQGASGQGGQINIVTDSLELSQGAVLGARTKNDALGGKITVNANTLTIDSGGQILTSAFAGGDAGNIQLNIAERIAISGSDPTFDQRREAVIEVGNQINLSDPELAIDPVSPASGIFANTTENSTGNSGGIYIKGLNNNTALLDLTIGDGGRISLDGQGSGNGGMLRVRANNLTLFDRAGISAATFSGQGGNIEIETDFLIGSGNSDIVATAREGRGGSIEITAERGIFGLETRTRLTPLSDIAAFSEQSPELDGEVILNTPEETLNQDLPDVSFELTETQVKQACQLDSSQELNVFVVTGRSGLPNSPQTALNADVGWEDWQVGFAPTDSHTAAPSDLLVNSHANKIVEAKSWMINDLGKLVLMAEAISNESPDFWGQPANCQSKTRSQ